MILAAIPIKPFGVAKARLSGVLDRHARSLLGRAVAAHTGAMVEQAGAEVAVVTADVGVSAWAKAEGLGVISEDPAGPPGLDGAAATVARHAAGMGLPWAVIHADLPLATARDFARVLEAARRGPVLAASYDGGTNVIAGEGPDFRFSFGPGSFQRHLARMPEAAVIITPSLALDLDTPRDLALARTSEGGRWLDDVIPPAHVSPSPIDPERADG